MKKYTIFIPIAWIAPVTMTPLPDNWLALFAVVFLLGLRHGMDPDHLATIDGLTRFNAAVRPRLSRWCGFLFSLGHGTVVIVVATLLGLFTKSWTIPAWMDGFGAWVSIFFLLALGSVNLVTLLRTPPEDVIRPAGFKGRFLGRLNRASRPGLVMLVGMLFALSFDTMSQTALFSLAASKMNGWILAALLGLTFMLGMMVTDGANGLWVSRLLRRADRRTRIASRVLGLTIVMLSFGVAFLGIAEFWSPQAASWSAGHGLYFGVGVLLIVLTSYLLAILLTRTQTSAVQSAASGRFSEETQ